MGFLKMLNQKLNSLLTLTFLGIHHAVRARYHSKLDSLSLCVYYSFSNCFSFHFSLLFFSFCLPTQYLLTITLIYLSLRFRDRLHIHQVSLLYHQHIFLAPIGNFIVISNRLFIKNCHHKNCFSSLKSFVLLSIV